MIPIGMGAQPRGKKEVAGDLPKGIQEALLMDAASDQLLLKHLFSKRLNGLVHGIPFSWLGSDT
jgi:hypothetical protein